MMHKQRMKGIGRFGILMALVVMLAACGRAPSAQVYSRQQAQRQLSVYYGTVLAVAPAVIEGGQTGLGAVTGGVLGGVAGHSVGGGHGQALATVAGAVGGLLLGSVVEEGAGRREALELTIELDSGELIAVVQAADETFVVGDRVRLVRGADGEVRIRQ
ncbi:glycine zipper 2TM domain-containing protein [Desulfuromonas thiophila]|uniref:glycine zipper 2TM domain-containing protein n=1 Tax=Desulfuromonas thiophila TaxID=57664 RepID=UPI0029F47E99|nr:glycine zipper 2TM domain-containing protein [Desulfuromonas thiophila]